MQAAKINAMRAGTSSSGKIQSTPKRASLVACRAGKADGPIEAVKKIALVAGAAVLMMGEPSAAFAAKNAPKAVATQGSTFDLIADSKAKTVTAKGSAEKAVYGAQKKYVAPSASKKTAPAKKTVTAKKEAFKAAAAAPVKFSATKGATQGTAPAGVTLPTPKGAITKVAVKKAAPAKRAAPKPAAAKKTESPKPAAPKPVVAAKKAENPLAKKKAAAAAAGAAATAVVVEKAAPVVVEAPPAPVVPKVKNYVKNTPAIKATPAPKASAPSFSFGGDAAEAGAVAAAEVVGVAIASSIVNGILANPRAAKRSSA